MKIPPPCKTHLMVYRLSSFIHLNLRKINKHPTLNPRDDHYFTDSLISFEESSECRRSQALWVGGTRLRVSSKPTQLFLHRGRIRSSSFEARFPNGLIK